MKTLVIAMLTAATFGLLGAPIAIAAPVAGAASLSQLNAEGAATIELVQLKGRCERVRRGCREKWSSDRPGKYRACVIGRGCRPRG